MDADASEALSLLTTGMTLDVTWSPPPASTDQCRDGGWRSFDIPTFRNQGECVRHVVTQAPPRA